MIFKNHVRIFSTYKNKRAYLTFPLPQHYTHMRLFTFKLESKLIARRRHHVTPSLRGSLVPLRRRHESSHFRFSDNDKSLPSSHRPKVRWKASSLPRRRSSQSRSRNRRKGHFVAGLHRSPFRESDNMIE